MVKRGAGMAPSLLGNLAVFGVRVGGCFEICSCESVLAKLVALYDELGDVGDSDADNRMR